MKPGELDRTVQRLAALARRMSLLGQEAEGAVRDARAALSDGVAQETASAPVRTRDEKSPRPGPEVEVVVK